MTERLGSSRTGRRALQNAAVFALALLATFWTLAAVLPLPAVPVIEPKIKYFRQHRDSFDTLFIGSSRVYHQILPSLFDESSAQFGLRTRSFNAGADAMRPPEDAFVLDQLLKVRPRRLRWVFIEAGGLRLTVESDKRNTIRAVYWHDWERTLLVCRLGWREFDDEYSRTVLLRRIPEPLGDVLEHLALFVESASNLGEGGAILRKSLDWKKARVPSPALGERLDGFRPTSRPEEITLEDRVAFERNAAERRRLPAVRDEADEFSQEALERMLQSVRDVGATPVLIIPPTTAKKNFFPRPETRPYPLVLDFSDVTQYPELYEPQHRLDTAHLNVAGGKLFTRRLVEKWAQAVRSGQ